MVPKEDCIESLLEAAERLGKSPTKAEYEELGMTPSSSNVRLAFGSWNEAKRAAGLELYRQSPGGSSVQPMPGWVDLPAGHEWEELSPQQRWYYKNREHRIAVKDRRRRLIRRWLYEYKRDVCSCERCGEGSPPCLDFHHAGKKEADISVMVNDGYSKDRIRKEIDRCIILCANCHQKLHILENYNQLIYDILEADVGRWTGEPLLDMSITNEEVFPDQKDVRKWVFMYKHQSDGCGRCGETEPVCFEFHHINKDDKSETIASLTRRRPFWSYLKNEIQKCDILCRNCHRKIHYQIPKPDT